MIEVALHTVRFGQAKAILPLMEIPHVGFRVPGSATAPSINITINEDRLIWAFDQFSYHDNAWYNGQLYQLIIIDNDDCTILTFTQPETQRTIEYKYNRAGLVAIVDSVAGRRRTPHEDIIAYFDELDKVPTKYATNPAMY